MMLYRLEHLVYRYDTRDVLDIEHLEFEEGRMHALVGHNGAGKSSLLMILAFLTAQTSGRVVYRGEAVEDSERARARLRREVVLVSQHPIMFSTTVRANIEFGLKLRKVDKAARSKTVDEVLDMVGLCQYRDAAAFELSGGETQRIALARALALTPRVLLCDEPTSSVDMENQKIIGDLLRRINREQGTTVIFTSHDRMQSRALGENHVVLENGRHIARGFDEYFKED